MFPHYFSSKLLIGKVFSSLWQCRKKQLYVERVAQLQRVLSSLQLASDRREQGERKLRMQLERELRNERARASGGPTSDDLGL